MGLLLLPRLKLHGGGDTILMPLIGWCPGLVLHLPTSIYATAFQLWSIVWTHPQDQSLLYRGRTLLIDLQHPLYQLTDRGIKRGLSGSPFISRIICSIKLGIRTLKRPPSWTLTKLLCLVSTFFGLGRLKHSFLGSSEPLAHFQDTAPFTKLGPHGQFAVGP